MQARINIVHIAYKGVAPALLDLIGGRIESMFSTVPSVLPAVRRGKVRALGVTSTTDPPSLPPSTAQVVLNQTGTGSHVSRTFTVVTRPWTLSWNIDCRPHRAGAAVTVERRRRADFVPFATTGTGPTVIDGRSPRYARTGTFHVRIATSCAWNLFVTEPSA